VHRLFALVWRVALFTRRSSHDALLTTLFSRHSSHCMLLDCVGRTQVGAGARLERGARATRGTRPLSVAVALPPPPPPRGLARRTTRPRATPERRAVQGECGGAGRERVCTVTWLAARVHGHVACSACARSRGLQHSHVHVHIHVHVVVSWAHVGRTWSRREHTHAVPPLVSVRVLSLSHAQAQAKGLLRKVEHAGESMVSRMAHRISPTETVLSLSRSHIVPAPATHRIFCDRDCTKPRDHM
jgi:hypothetical protein